VGGAFTGVDKIGLAFDCIDWYASAGSDSLVGPPRGRRLLERCWVGTGADGWVGLLVMVEWKWKLGMEGKRRSRVTVPQQVRYLARESIVAGQAFGPATPG